ncbi:MAG: TolC family protein, partial [Sedimenticola sp.]
SLKQHLVSSQNTRDAYVQQFNIGKRTLLDLLNTENEVFQAKRAYREAEYDSLFAEYRILAGVGGLLGHFGYQAPAGEGEGDRMMSAHSELAPQAIDVEDFESKPEHGYTE